MDKRLGIRIFWLCVGLLCVGLALLGAVLPLLPTTPFALLAAYAFAQSSPRLSRWIENHRLLGPLIDNWRRHRAISRRAKFAAMTVIAATPLISMLLDWPWWIIAIQLVALSCVSFFILTRPDGPER